MEFLVEALVLVWLVVKIVLLDGLVALGPKELAVRIAHDWLVAKRLNCKPQPKLKCLLVFFVPTVLHICLSYVWFWHLLALWVAPGAIQRCNKQASAVLKVCTLKTPLHLTKHRGSQWALIPKYKCLFKPIIHQSGQM